MKTKLAMGAGMALCLVLMTVPTYAQDAPKKFSLVLAGGYGTTTGGDIPKVLEGMNATIRDLAAVSGFTVTDTFEGAKWGPNFEAELRFRPGRRFGVGFGVGYLRKPENTRVGAELAPLARVSADWDVTYYVIPLKLSGYYFFPVGAKMTLYARAGVGYYFGKMTYTIRTEEALLGVTIWDQNDGEATGGGFGFHGGLGLEYPVTPGFAIFIEAAGRYVNLKGWSVDNVSSNAWGTERETGKFWYGEEFVEDLGEYYASLELSEVKPTNPDLRNVREAAFAFSGFALKAGMKISF